MLYVISFTLSAPSIKFIACKEFPFRLFTNKHVMIELDKQDHMMMVESNQKILINNSEKLFSQVKSHDVIAWKNNIFILMDDYHYGNESFFIGLIQYNHASALLFNGPERIYDSFFNNLSQMIAYYPEIKQVVINCNAIAYMDSESIAAMIELINCIRQRHCSIFFYSSSPKFNSYLKLSNINKIVEQISPNQSVQTAIDGVGSVNGQIPFALQNKLERYCLTPDMVNYIGRSVDLCNIGIDNASVSRIHAGILLIQNCIYIVDFGSSNGTFINKEQVVPFTLHLLKLNDQLFFGNTYPLTVVLN